MHRAHFELTARAVKAAEANLLLHPAVGMTSLAHSDPYTRVRCYEHVLRHYPEDDVAAACATFVGLREAVWHAIIRRSFLTVWIIVGRDHAGPGNDANGTALMLPMPRKSRTPPR